jgi:hypothetical protein
LNGEPVVFNSNFIPQFILADSGYPNLRKVMTPYKKNEFNALPTIQKARIKKFNKRLSRGRILVEQTIGAWKMRFPILKQTCRIRKRNVTTIVMGTAILHNILNSLGIELPEFMQENDFVEEVD